MPFALRCALPFLLMVSLSAHALTPKVAVAEGTLVGAEESGVTVFKAIPYAAPPVGVRRWRAPEPPAAWSGERLATEFGAICMQVAYGADSVFASPLPPQSEDCLTLNVWTTNLGGDARRPVMVWLHGGGLTRGSGRTPTYDGGVLAKKGVVLVTINYRLGAFGFLAHPELSAESPHGSSGNYGVLDQIAALTWIQTNIARFGGDPGNVTIFGESAGARSVAYLTATPLAAGLFHRAIAESGGAFAPMPALKTAAYGRAAHESLGERFAATVGAADLDALRARTAADILTAFAGFGAERLAEGNVDGWVFPDHVEAIYAAGRQHRVPLILGSNKDEGTSLTAPGSRPRTAVDARAALAASLGVFAEEAAALYGIDNDPERGYLAALRDQRFTWSMHHWAELASAAGQNVYLYFFTFEPPGPLQPQLRAYHAAEIRYAFGNGHLGANGGTAEEHALADIMSDYWSTFAATGTPISAKAATWPKYTADVGQYLELAATPKAGRALLPEETTLMDKVARALWNVESDNSN